MKLELEASAPCNLTVAEISSANSGAKSSSEEVESLVRFAIERARAGDADAARRSFLRATELDPADEAAWLWLASISEYPEELIVFLQKVLDINPANARALEWMRATQSLLSKTFVQRGIKAVQENRREFAAHCFRQAIEHEETNETGWLWLASITEQKEEKAIYLRNALAINPENEAAREKLLEAESGDRRELLQKATSAAISGSRDEARRMLDEILADSPQMEEAWILQAYLAESFYEKMSAYEKVLGINPENEAAQAGLASLRAMQMANEFKSPVAGKTASANAPLFSAEKNAAVSGFSASGEKPEAAAEIITEENVSGAADDFDRPTRELDAEVFAAAEKVFGEHAEPQHVSGAPDAAYSAPESFVSPNEDDFLPEMPETASANEEDFVRLLDSEDADEVEFVDAENLNYDDFDAEFSDSVEQTIFDEPSAENDYAAEISGELSACDLPDVSEEALQAVEPANDFATADDRLEGSETDDSSAPDAERAILSPPADFSLDSSDYSNSDQNYSPAPAADTLPAQWQESEAHAEVRPCPFCSAPNDAQAIACASCSAMLSLSDIESMLARRNADAGVMMMAINDLEAEKLRRGLSLMQLTDLGVAYLNAGDFRKGLEALREASRMTPNDVVLSSKVNYLAIRLAEIEAQDCKAADSPFKCKTIMVVDDSPTVRKLISGKLEKSGHTVVCAVDGMDALSKVAEQTPDMILLDINMPNMDGYQVCKLIRGNELTKDIPVVMISGKDGFFDKVRGRMAGSTGYITKPFGPETLMRTLETYLN